MREPILVINAGSSSVKFSVFETMADRCSCAGEHGEVEGIGTSPHLRGRDTRGRPNSPISLSVPKDQEGAIAAIHDWFAAHIGSEAGFPLLATVSFMADRFLPNRC